jgi:uncharacterized phage-associated protein
MNKEVQKNKQITCEIVADYFLALANETGETITNLKLQKLVYYAQAWYLANFKTPLFKEDFEAWVHGPVIPQLYHQYKEKGSEPILTTKKLNEVKVNFDSKTLEFLDMVANAYISEGGYKLELMTHQEKPWQTARQGYEADQTCKVIISKDVMKEYYGQRIKN